MRIGEMCVGVRERGVNMRVTMARPRFESGIVQVRVMAVIMGVFVIVGERRVRMRMNVLFG